MSTEFASASYTAGQLNAIVKLLKKQAGEDGPDRFLRGEITVSEPHRSWWEEDGVIYFSVTSDGTSGETWIKRLEGNSFHVTAERLLRSPAFRPTSGVTTEVAVLKGSLFEDNDRIGKTIRAYAIKRGLYLPNAEIACLIREKFTDADIEAMGLKWIVAMHYPIKDPKGGWSLLCSGRFHSGRLLSACFGGPDYGWDRDCGFAFAMSPRS